MPWKPLEHPVPWEGLERSLPRFVHAEDSFRIPPPLPANYHAQLFYNIGLREVLDPATLNAVPYGWRFLTSVSPAAAVYVNSAGSATGVSFGEGINQAREASAALAERIPVNSETAAAVDPSVYEVRVLRINGLSIEGYWLKATEPDADLFVPYLTLGTTFNGRPLAPDHAYPLLSFLGQLQAQAKELLDFPPVQRPYPPGVR